jgi:hypothetical protein
MFDRNKIYMIPPLLTQKGEELLNNKGHSQFKENYAAQFEAIVDYCQDVLTKYNNSLKFKRHK